MTTINSKSLRTTVCHLSLFLYVGNCLNHETQCHDGLKVKVHKEVLKNDTMRGTEWNDSISTNSETHMYMSVLCEVVQEEKINNKDVPSRNRWTVCPNIILCCLASVKLNLWSMTHLLAQLQWVYPGEKKHHPKGIVSILIITPAVSLLLLLLCYWIWHDVIVEGRIPMYAE